jgi:peptide-methionine (S)-S-oxide reductase
MEHQTQTSSSSVTKQALHETSSMEPSLKVASIGDVVTVQMELTPENGLVLEPLFDTSGQISFVLGGGNYLPGLHELVQGMRIGQEVKGVSIDGGWGQRNPDLVIDVPKSNLKKMKNIDTITVGATLNLKGGIQVSVLKVTDDIITVDANPSLAGAGYTCDLTVLNIESYPDAKLLHNTEELTTAEEASSSSSQHLQVASWAMGCFWGGELAFMRTPGVVGTRVGYTQGVKDDPTYEEVCKGDTKHREAIVVVFDSRVVSYKELIKVFMERLAATVNQYKQMIDIFAEDDDDSSSSLQYQHGIYYHNEQQRLQAEEAVAANNNKYNVELRQAAKFYDAEQYHQQYLLKGGQSARKGCKETIRCFG